MHAVSAFALSLDAIAAACDGTDHAPMPLTDEDRPRALALGEAYLGLARAHLGRERGQLLEACRQIKGDPATRTTLVVMLTARGEEEDRVRGLETGADDYVTKPFSPRELVARVGAVLRRVRPALAGEALSYSDIEMDTVGHKVRRGGEVISLGPTEFRLLKHFLEHPGWVFSRERLLDAVWGHDSDIESRTVDVHIRRLRKAINNGDRPDIIRTVRSAGYALDAGN